MNAEARLNVIYKKLADTVIQSIPEEWKEVYLYGEITEDVGKSFFFYTPLNNNNLIYCHDIPDLFSVSQEEYDRLWYLSLDHLKELWEEFRKSGNTPWTNLTMLFDNTGSFKIEYDYEDLSSADDHERMIVWEYRYLGLVPQHESDKKYLDSYLKSKKG